MNGNATGRPVNESPGFAPICYDYNNQELKVFDPNTSEWRAVATVEQ